MHVGLVSILSVAASPGDNACIEFRLPSHLLTKCPLHTSDLPGPVFCDVSDVIMGASLVAENKE